MKFVLHLFICIMVFISVVNCLSITESINVSSEEGTLYTYTHSGAANDFVQAAGKQTYTRILSSDGEELSLDSIYNLMTPMIAYQRNENTSFDVLWKNHTKNMKYSGLDFPYSQNQYAISMRSPSGLESDLSVKGWPKGQKGFSAENKIVFVVPKLGASAANAAKQEVSTEYVVSGAGDLSASVLNLYTGRHPNAITQTIASSSEFTYELGVADTINGFGSDPSAMLGNLADVNITTEKGVSDPAEDLTSKLNKKIINESEYIKFLEMYWKNGIVSGDRLLSDSKVMLEINKINKKQYDGIFEEVQNSLINGIELEANLTAATNQFLSGSMKKEVYLKVIDDKWVKRELLDMDYVDLLSSLKEKGKIGIDEYDERFEKVQNRILEDAGVTNSVINSSQTEGTNQLPPT